MGRAFVNSFMVFFGCAYCFTIIGTQLAYVLSRFKLKNAIIKNLFLFASLLPGIAMQVPLYKIMHDLGFINTLMDTV